VVTRRRSCLCVALSAGVYDITGVAIPGLPVRIKDPLPDPRSALVGWLSRHAARVDERPFALSAAVIPRTALLRMRDAELSACSAACSMRASASQCRLHASGVEGAGMAQSSIAAAMSF
jgi:hypothetical protein